MDSAKMPLPFEMRLLAQSLSQLARQEGKLRIFSDDSNPGLKGMDNGADSLRRLSEDAKYFWGL